MLYIVPTPIGNLRDITLRALDTLKQVDLILAEDTRTSSKLLNHYGIRRPLTPFHQYNEHQVLRHLLHQLAAGTRMALITDAGTPGISDPGYLLVRGCIRENIRVECLPGATAFVPALVSSGIPSTRFCFEGFLPPKKGRQTLLRQLAQEERTILIYESPQRLLRTLGDLAAHLGEDRSCCVSREISKLHEEHFRGSLKEAAQYFGARPVKGEIVLTVAGLSDPKVD